MKKSDMFRMLLVYYLRRAGLANDTIARQFLCYGRPAGFVPGNHLIKSKAKGIDKMWAAFEDKMAQSIAFGIDPEGGFAQENDPEPAGKRPGTRFRAGKPGKACASRGQNTISRGGTARNLRVEAATVVGPGRGRHQPGSG